MIDPDESLSAIDNERIHLRAVNAELLDALCQFTAAIAAHIVANALAIAGRDGRERVTLETIEPDHAIVNALQLARAAIAKATESTS